VSDEIKPLTALAFSKLELDPRDRLAILGKTGTGKSNLAKLLAAEMMRRGIRIVAYDPEDEWSQLGRERDGEVTLGPLIARITADELRFNGAAILDSEALALAVVPDDDLDQAAADFEYLADLVKHTGHVCLIIDETGTLQLRAAEKLDAVFTRWRKYSVPVVCIAQRAVQVPKTARGQLSQIICFRQDDVSDVAALAERVRDEAWLARVPTLADGEFLYWRDVAPTPERKAAS
jgi:nucleoside-triphosphatase THEP1